MERFNPFLWRKTRDWYRFAYVVAAVFFIWCAAQWYIPGKGFTGLISFGGGSELHRIRELAGVSYAIDQDTLGYDGQYYAQIAVKPLPGSRDLQAAVDNLPYRARRILFCWTAFGLGLGQPWLILQAYALQNVLCWLVLGWLLTRWFPATNLDNLVRWAGTMFTWGMTMSVRQALMDGPSLLLIAVGVMLAEQGRRWASACVLGVAGLGRETNVLAAATHFPTRDWSAGAWGRAAGRSLLVAGPLLAWMAYLWWIFGEPSNTGYRNLGPPLQAYLAKWGDAIAAIRANIGDSSARWTLILLVSMTVQALAILLRPRWSSAWWRVGAMFTVLFVFLGPSVWAGYPGAAPRVVLPMVLAFNAVLPRGRWWWAVLLLGNLTILTAPDELGPLGRESYRVEGPAAVWKTPANQSLEVTFGPEWYQGERSSFEYWRWSRGSAGIVITNPQPVPVEIELDFDLRAFDTRTVRVFQGAALRWQGQVSRESAQVRLPAIRLEPGGNPWRFEVTGPPSGDAVRPVTFNLRNLVIRAERTLDGAAPASP